MKLWERFYSRKNMMDEMQEQTQLRIESAGYQVAFWGLLAAMVVQGILHCPPASMAGAWVVFMTLCLYVLVREMRSGLWDRHLKPNLGTNLCSACWRERLWRCSVCSSMITGIG